MGQLASRYQEAAQKAGKAGSEDLRALAQVGVGLVKREIQDMHAVDTGTMLNSTTADKAGPNTWLIGPTVQYAPYVALGTSRVAARPFHVRAARKLASQVSDFGFSADRLGL
uniref:Minor capsid protein n=1 Tax=Micrococcus phage Olihed TaxID=3092209 RepID=A0AAU6R5Z5_9CAUD